MRDTYHRQRRMMRAQWNLSEFEPSLKLALHPTNHQLMTDEGNG